MIKSIKKMKVYYIFIKFIIISTSYQIKIAAKTFFRHINFIILSGWLDQMSVDIEPVILFIFYSWVFFLPVWHLST